jgi:hypothetical protein
MITKQRKASTPSQTASQPNQSASNLGLMLARSFCVRKRCEDCTTPNSRPLCVKFQDRHAQYREDHGCSGSTAAHGSLRRFACHEPGAGAGQLPPSRPFLCVVLGSVAQYAPTFTAERAFRLLFWTVAAFAGSHRVIVPYAWWSFAFRLFLAEYRAVGRAPEDLDSDFLVADLAGGARFSHDVFSFACYVLRRAAWGRCCGPGGP